MGERPRTRISEPRKKTYPYKKRFYRSEEVAAHYDADRFHGPFKRARNRRKWRALIRALDSIEPPPTRLLDLPCGTGRFTGSLAARRGRVVGCDISLEMMRRARETTGGREEVLGFVQADAERLPFTAGALDGVVCVRFMFHVDPPIRIRILREMGRVSRYQIVDYRHKYSYRWAKWRLARALGLSRRPLERVSREGLEAEFREAELAIRDIFPVTRIFSDKWIVVSERA